jgi:hypothetical protein
MDLQPTAHIVHESHQALAGLLRGVEPVAQMRRRPEPRQLCENLGAASSLPRDGGGGRKLGPACLRRGLSRERASGRRLTVHPKGFVLDVLFKYVQILFFELIHKEPLRHNTRVLRVL